MKHAILRVRNWCLDHPWPWLRNCWEWLTTRSLFTTIGLWIALMLWVYGQN
ncbi:hypothetical protein ACSL103130_05500 [Actinomyces slackii]|uniref:Uncharacterized protein n=1 Tax=Actinomyces slackii TaxID=52774 RepID=A0A448KCW6_9ACTO|nr:Uncharacterised protein [Actinomyces slackii]